MAVARVENLTVSSDQADLSSTQENLSQFPLIELVYKNGTGNLPDEKPATYADSDIVKKLIKDNQEASKTRMSRANLSRQETQDLQTEIALRNRTLSRLDGLFKVQSLIGPLRIEVGRRMEIQVADLPKEKRDFWQFVKKEAPEIWEYLEQGKTDEFGMLYQLFGLSFKKAQALGPTEEIAAVARIEKFDQKLEDSPERNEAFYSTLRKVRGHSFAKPLR